MKRCLGLYFICTLFVFSCHTETSTNNSINGIWESIGSGLLLEIKDSVSYSFYDITTISCLASRTGNVNVLDQSLSKDTLTVNEGVLNYKFTRIEKLPDLCNLYLEQNKLNDPLYNFDVFSETVTEHYAFLELNKISWDSLY